VQHGQCGEVSLSTDDGEPRIDFIVGQTYRRNLRRSTRHWTRKTVLMCDELVRSVERFVYREARLLDRRRFHECLDCFTEDTHYSVPVRATTRSKGNARMKSATHCNIPSSHAAGWSTRRMFHGCREDLLRKVDGGWKIARRKVIYDTTVSPSKNLSIFF
jgi:3-phenylpropionate/cinnamic acid dioxygenase small subunit